MFGVRVPSPERERIIAGLPADGIEAAELLRREVYRYLGIPEERAVLRCYRAAYGHIYSLAYAHGGMTGGEVDGNQPAYRVHAPRAGPENQKTRCEVPLVTPS